MPGVYEIESTPQELSHINKITLGEHNAEKREGTASSAVTEKRGGTSDRLIKDKESIDKYFKEKSETL
jgi:hypothetical protein